MFLTLHVPEHSVAVRFRKGDFYDVLRPGKHYVRGPRFGDRQDHIVLVNRDDAPRRIGSSAPVSKQEPAFASSE